MKLCGEISFGSLIKKEQELCGDKVELLKKEGELLLILSDGLGSGVKANILATLTSKIIMTMMDGGAKIDEVSDTLVNTLPVCKERRVAYSTFTIIHIKNGDVVYLHEYDNPDTIIVRDRAIWEPEKEIKVLNNKQVKEINFNIKLGDWYVAMSDGVAAASNTRLVRDSWSRENIAKFVLEKSKKDKSAFLMKKIILEECFRRYDGIIDDDSTVAVCKITRESHITVMIGPPLDPNDDRRIVESFMANYGKKIICGGRTARIVSSITGKKLSLAKRSNDSEVPPMGYMEDVDLVTEGIVTVTKAVEIVKSMDGLSVFEYERMASSDNGAERLVHALMEGGTNIEIYLGRANNAAHDSKKGIAFGEKLKVVEILAEELKRQHKTVKIEYC